MTWTYCFAAGAHILMNEAIGGGVNGVCAYRAGATFPSNVSFANGDNYWVDLVFNDSPQPPAANNNSGFAMLQNKR